MLTQKDQNSILTGALKSANLETVLNLPNDKVSVFLEGIKFGIRSCSLFVQMNPEEEQQNDDDIQANG